MTYKIKLRQIEPPVLEANQISISTYEKTAQWLGARGVDLKMKMDGTPNEVVFLTSERSLIGKEGSWIIKDETLDVPFFIISDEEFKKKYQVQINVPATQTEKTE